MKNKPHNVKVAHDSTELSGYEYLVTDKRCEGCGANFVLWYEQRKCPYCGKDHEPKSIMWVCS